MQKTERSDQEFFEEIREKDNIMQILGPEVGGGHLYMRPFDQNLGDASPPSLGLPPVDCHDILATVQGELV